jgi:hypothetical protein
MGGRLSHGDELGEAERQRCHREREALSLLGRHRLEAAEERLIWKA